MIAYGQMVLQTLDSVITVILASDSMMYVIATGIVCTLFGLVISLWKMKY